MKQYKYFLLDWDGNLARTLDIWLEACRVPLLKRGLNISDEQIGASFGAFIPHLIEWGVEDPEAALEEADKIAAQKLPYVELYPDALEVLELLHARGKKLALITTSPHANVGHLLERYNIRRFFDVIIGGDDVHNHKPHPEPLEKALTHLKGQKELAVMIGDSDKDLGAAHNFGIDSVLFYPEEHKKYYSLDKLKSLNPTYIFSDFSKVLELAA